MSGGPWDRTEIGCARCGHEYRATLPACSDCGCPTHLTRLALEEDKPRGLAAVEWRVVIPISLGLWVLIIWALFG